MRKFKSVLMKLQQNISKCVKKKIVVAWGAFCVLATICGFIGVSLKDFYEKDWQVVAEEYNNTGLDYFSAGDYEMAIDCYNKAIKLEKKGITDIEVCYFNRGRAYYKLQKYEQAVGDYTKALEIKEKSKYYYERAEAYDAMGESINAMMDRIKAATAIVE